MESYFTFLETASVTEGKDDDAPIKNILSDYKVFFVHRSTILPKLLVRDARVEDNDDLLPILQRWYPDLISVKDEHNFLLADMIDSQDERNKIFVGCLRNNEAVGMLSTSCDVNISLLTKIFDVDAFPDVAIKQRERPLPPPLVLALAGDIRQVDLVALENTVSGMDSVLVNVQLEASAIFSEKGLASGDPIRFYLEEKMESYREVGGESSRPPPQAFVVFGYPHTEAEVDRRGVALLSHLDGVLELRGGEESEDEDEDEFLQLHLDAVEALRELHASRSGLADCRTDWRRVEIGGNSGDKLLSLHQVAGELSRFLEARFAVIQSLLDEEKDVPLRANAFAVTLFALDEEFVSRTDDLLRLAFEEQPQLQYCLFMLPNAAPHNPLVKSFTYVHTRPGLSFDQSLYLLHRSYYLAKEFLEVSRLDLFALNTLEHFLLPLPEGQRRETLALAETALKEAHVELKDNPKEVCMVVKIADSIVGCVLLSRKVTSEEDLLWFRAHYNVDDFVNFDRYRSARAVAAISRWTLNPIYSRWTRFILREVMRLYYKKILFYHGDKAFTPPKEVLEECVHLNPRRKMDLAKGSEAAGAFPRPSARQGGLGAENPLYFVTKRVLSSPKMTVTKRVVVVGGSSHSYALLEALCSVPYLNLPNVFLIIEKPPLPLRNGVAEPAVEEASARESSEEAKLDDDYSGCLSVTDVDHPLEQELFAMGLAHKINVVRGSLTDVDRESKAVVVSDELALEFDLLVFSSNTQGRLG